MGIDEKKQQLREDLKTRRARMPAAERRDEDAAVLKQLLDLPALREARRVFCFVSHGDEIDTHALLDELLRRDKHIVVPRIRPEGMIAVAFSDWSELRPGQLGILTPVSTEPCDESVDVCITPGLGFTVSGKRLGYGRGYYDRWFAAHSVPHRIAIGYDCQVLEDLPVSDFDVPVTMLVTGKRRVET